MIVSSLELTNYRNYDNQKISFSPNLNVLVGKNAQGKTNMLEGIFLCAIGRSPRTSKDKELIKWNCTFSKIKLEVEKNIGHKKIELYLFNNQNKAIKIDGIGIKKLGELFGEFNAVYFSPDELKLIKESPDERRRFMDIDLSQFSKQYFYNLSKYNEILAQRNKLLKTTVDPKVIKDTIPIWNEELSKVGANIILDRMSLIEKLKVYAKDIHKYITDNEEELEISYSGYTAKDYESLKDILLTKYTEALDKDMKLGYTTVGPHRDDIKIVSNGIDIRSFGSQGQQRTAALSLKLAELEVFKDNIGEYPVLLLDDVLSELDDDRQLKLLTHIQPLQTILTCTSFDIDVPHTSYFVVDGAVVESKEI